MKTKRCGNCHKMMCAKNCIQCYQQSLKQNADFKNGLNVILKKAAQSKLKISLLDYLKESK